MYRVALALVLSTQAAAAFAAGACSVSGKALDPAGRPVRDAVVRITDLQTRQIIYSAADANAGFQWNSSPARGPTKPSRAKSSTETEATTPAFA